MEGTVVGYSEKLKDPRWQKKRLEIFQRDKFSCVICQAEDITLHAHHVAYEKDTEPWEYDNKNIVTLCEECHTEIHAGYKDALRMLFGKIQEEKTFTDWEIENAEQQYSYDVGGIMRYLKEDVLLLGGEHFKICNVKREFEEETGNIKFTLEED
jgi:hypothetical protein